MKSALLLLIYIVALPLTLRASLLDVKEQAGRYARAEDWPHAIYGYQQIVAAGRTAGPVLLATAWNNLGYVYFYGRADYAKAYECFLQSQTIAQEAGDEEMLPYVDLNLANVYTIYKDEENAITHLRRAFRGAARLRLFDIAITSIEGLAITAMDTAAPQLAAAELSLFDSIQWPPHTRGLTNARHVVAACRAMAAGRLAEAADLLGRVDTLGTGTLTPERLTAQCAMLRASLIGRQGRLAEAAALLREADRDTLPPDLRIELLEAESNILATLGRTDSALSTHAAALRLSDSLYRRQRYSRIRDLRSDYEMRQAAQRLHEAEARRRAAWLWTALSLTVALTVGALALMLVRQNRQLRQKNAALYQKTRDDIAQHAPRPQVVDEELLAKVNAAMADPEAITTDAFTIDRLARLIGSNTTYVSRAINAATGKNFATLLGEARVRLACQRLVDPAYARYTVEGIAQDLGFRSRTNFIAVFKRTTGLTPSEYRRMGRSDAPILS